VQTIDIEVLLAVGYAVLLVTVAFGLELVARHAHRHSERWRVAGFRYRRAHDVWECPAGERLVRVSSDYARGVARYRAPARACNVCALKPLCTDSPHGREIEHQPDAWFGSELARFHRGMSLTLLLLASAWLVAEMFRHREPHELLLLGGVLVPITLRGAQLLSAFADSRRRARDADPGSQHWR
jgi:hypothetical protein